MTKWFFALSEASLGHPDHDWPQLIRVAVRSARERTRLRPHFLYDGPPNEFTAELEQMGVTVVWHCVSYLGNIRARWEQIGLPFDAMRLAIIAGAYLRTEIPLIETDEEYVLYTDCDVMFLADPEIERFRPDFFACAPQRYPDQPEDMNSGVMVMNVPAMRHEAANFFHFIVNNFERFGAYDQDALREYYAGRYEALPLELNWKPYWGLNGEARIVHFHGPKPDAARRLTEHPEYPAPAIWRELYNENPEAYREYVQQWDGWQSAAPPAVRDRSAG